MHSFFPRLSAAIAVSFFFLSVIQTVIFFVRREDFHAASWVSCCVLASCAARIAVIFVRPRRVTW